MSHQIKTDLNEVQSTENENELLMTTTIQPDIDGKSIKPTSSRTQYYLAFLIFMLIGLLHLLNWNLVLTVNGQYVELFKNARSVTDIVATAYSVTSLLITAVFLNFDLSYPIWTYVGALTGIISLIMYFTALFKYNNFTYSLYMASPVIMSIGSALMGCSVFGYAKRIMGGFDGAVSSGLGLSGLYALVVWVICSKVSFDSSTTDGLRKALLTTFSVSLSVYVLCMVALYVFEHLPWVRKYIYIQAPLDDADKPLSTKDNVGVIQNFKSTIRQCHPYSFCLFANMFMTLFLFPNFTPVFSDPGKEFYFVATFIVGDFIGRYLPNMQRLMPSKKWLFILTACRLKIIFIGLISIFVPHLNNSVIRYINTALLGITNGHTTTASLILNGQSVTLPREAAIVGSIGLLALQLGISSAQLSSILITRFALSKPNL